MAFIFCGHEVYFNLNSEKAAKKKSRHSPANKQAQWGARTDEGYRENRKRKMENPSFKKLQSQQTGKK
jgi:hypothetical protein